jgi:hypothetical protein
MGLARKVAVAASAIALALPTSAFGLTTFRSPSGNIGCAMDRSFGVRCDIAKRDWPLPRKPASCDLDYGQGVSVGSRGRAYFVCAGDTVLGARRVLAYGRTVVVGRYSCTSAVGGMACRNRTSGHGFTLSRQRYRLL